MPIKAYVGQMRSGKSYEVVSNVILNGLRDGRRVVSNIAGLNYDAMRELLLEEGVAVDQIGELVVVDHDQVSKPSFWRTDKDADAGFDSFIQPGDLVALDEVWRFFKKRGDIEPRALNFFRMHGHMPHPEKGFICEIALITQSIRDINENIRDVIQETYRMTKNTAVGSESTYRVDIFSGGSVAKSSFLRQLQRKYNPRYFPLYSSHSQKTGVSAVEKNIDNRANVLQGGLFKFVIPAMLLVILGGVYFVYGFFNPKPKEAKAIEPAAGASVQGSPAVSQAKQEPRRLDVSENWRVVGWYSTDTGIVAVVQDQAKRLRYLYDPPAWKVQGMQISVALPEGGTATTYSGGVVENSLPGGNL